MAEGAGMGMADDSPMPQEDMHEGAATIIIPKEALGGRKVKSGDMLTIKVGDVDPETGEVEATVSSGGQEAESDQPGYARAIDEMPETPET